MHTSSKVISSDLLACDTSIVHLMVPDIGWLFHTVLETIDAFLLCQIYSILYLSGFEESICLQGVAFVGVILSHLLYNLLIFLLSERRILLSKISKAGYLLIFGS